MVTSTTTSATRSYLLLTSSLMRDNPESTSLLSTRMELPLPNQVFYFILYEGQILIFVYLLFAKNGVSAQF